MLTSFKIRFSARVNKRMAGLFLLALLALSLLQAVSSFNFFPSVKTVNAPMILDHKIDLFDEGLVPLSQNDWRWANYPIGKYNVEYLVMGNYGCLLTSIAMVANYVGVAPTELIDTPPWSLWDPFVVSPVYVNHAILEHDGYYSGYANTPGLSVDYDRALIGSFKGAGPGLLSMVINVYPWDRLTGNTVVTINSILEIDETFGGECPPIFILHVVPGALVNIQDIDYRHAVVVAGWDNNSKSYLIWDPLWVSENTINGPADARLIDEIYGENWAGLVEQVLIPVVVPAGSQNHISAASFSPVQPLVFDPQGRMTGFNVSTGKEISDIPSSSYYLEPALTSTTGTTPPQDPAKVISIRNPSDGLYRFQIEGTGDGPFALVFRASNNVTSFEQEVDGNIAEGQILKYELTFTSNGSLGLMQVPTFTPYPETRGDFDDLTGRSITFDASRSFDIDGSIVSYAWDFGDGSNAMGMTVTHAYATPGNFTIRLIVEDNDGATASKTIEAQIILSETRPIADIRGPYIGYANSSEVCLHLLRCLAKIHTTPTEIL